MTGTSKSTTCLAGQLHQYCPTRPSGFDDASRKVGRSPARASDRGRATGPRLHRNRHRDLMSGTGDPAGSGGGLAVRGQEVRLLLAHGPAVDVCVALAIVFPVTSADVHRSQATLKVAAAMGITLIAMYGVLSRPGFGYFTSSIETLERRVVAAASSAGVGADGRDYAVELPESDGWIDLCSRRRSSDRVKSKWRIPLSSWDGARDCAGFPTGY